MTKVFTIINEEGVERSRYEIGDNKLVCGFQYLESGKMRSFNSIDELLCSITVNTDINSIRITNKINLEDVFITIKEIEITEEYLVSDCIPNTNYKHKGYRGEFVDSEFTDYIYLTNQYPIFLNGNREVWNLSTKSSDIPAYVVVRNLGLSERYFSLESLCGYLEGNSALEDDLYQITHDRLLNMIKIKLFDDFPNWDYKAKRLVKNIEFLTNVKITKQL